ncbi:hypothetical protein HC028_06200 [Planosporangium flavigriseum]|uniref:Uncharacterized protein n=1 Tax=Planosporangium flavigriseum TaxID=373681 RepID=A0A8J3PMJ1_9ACTN|nr:hypothetical protein [Planosporangium flavigriseum]NJC64104.1 hypothetical protein [Planosporangium flavigriseum]GIG72986.1 hypothetical protein Pfl04_13900 [Planosporangium flavigriseum]
MDAHRKVSPDEFDGPGHEPEWGSSSGLRPTDGAAVLAMPLAPRPGEPQSPQSYTPPAPPGAPEAYVPEPYAHPVPESYAPPAYAPEPPAAPAAAHTAPTSSLPYLTGAGAPQPSGYQPPAGDARPVSGDPRPASSGAWGGDQAEETQAMRRSTEPIDRSALRRPSGGAGQLGDGVYRSQRPGMAVAIVAVTVLFELMALRLLASAFLTSNVRVGDSIASAFLVVGLPMFGVGLYGLFRGVAAAPGTGLRVWLRPPLVYLPVALTLFVTAGLAAA